MELPEWLGQANFIATTTNIFARAAYLRANPMRDYRFIHDYFFLSTAALEQQIEIVPEVLMEYRVHGSNTIATRPEPLMREMIRLQLDLYRHHAETLRTQPEFRKRFYSYVRGTWNSISSLHAGMVQVALAQLAAQARRHGPGKGHGGVAAVLSSIEFPNKTLAGAHDGNSGLSVGGRPGQARGRTQGEARRGEEGQSRRSTSPGAFPPEDAAQQMGAPGPGARSLSSAREQPRQDTA